MRDVIYVESRFFVSTVKNSFKFLDLVKKEEKIVPFDDVGYLIFENSNSYFSKKMVERCLEYDIEILFCDSKHSPVAVISSVYGQNQRLKKLKGQLELSSKAKKRLWRKIVVSKINNQADCLIQVAGKNEDGQFLQIITKNVDEGDYSNREAYAARRYFPALFGPKFKRGRYDDIVNSGLNYGYALIRSLIRKEIVTHGLEPSWGIHHESTENPFNLSDDLIEPFRPFVDMYVYEHLFENDVYGLELEDKKLLLKILFLRCVIDNKVYVIADAVRVVVESYLTCIDKNSATGIKVPSFIEGGI